MAVFAKFKVAGTDLKGLAHNVKVAAGSGLAVPDLNGSSVLKSANFSTAMAGSGAGGQTYSLSCTKEIDEASPKLLEACDNNKELEGTIYFTRMAEGAKGTNEECYMTAEIKGARVLSQSIGESGEGMGVESLQIRYDTLEVTYKGGIVYVVEWAKRTG